MASTKQIRGPRIACEITPERVIAARATEDGLQIDTSFARSLTRGALMPNLTEPNLVDRGAVNQALTDALSTVGGRGRDVIAVLPDASVRISLLDFESMPDDKEEADGVIRFRLKKALPFNVDDAAVSYDIRRNNGMIRVIAAVALRTVLEEYEAAFRDAGYSPGVVLPSMLATLGHVDATTPTLVIKVDATTTSVAILGNNDILLFRTLENPQGMVPGPEQLVDDVYPSLVFFQDTYNMRVERVLVGGIISAEQVGPALESYTGVRAQDLVSMVDAGSATGGVPKTALAGVVGALLA